MDYSVNIPNTVSPRPVHTALLTTPQRRREGRLPRWLLGNRPRLAGSGCSYGLENPADGVGIPLRAGYAGE